MKERKNKRKKPIFLCDNKVKSFKEEIICSQDDLHKSLEGNPLGFIIFYVFSVLFVAFLFQLTTKNMSKKGKKKINNLSIIIIVLLSLHYLLIISPYMISDLFDLKANL